MQKSESEHFSEQMFRYYLDYYPRKRFKSSFS
ncbi:unnamed protein product [Acanthoscelides obtectus]|uniref:Uncharacterized protein n=1 Tax=Acanthoscelides obtectus TaxID=200917 RepID=A0A9P0K119_ACAOB|nr:unnamed protein product [Acanthoscelides obtectus]CAK1623765.1 hypothetical protein AOBTE_LOCUS2165 [Acanthoscelides obtectus]